MQKETKSGRLSFWTRLAVSFPSLKGAVSTEYYSECERLLYREFFPDLGDQLLLKTDLWNEAKSTEILRWAAAQGARPVGIDISLELVREAVAAMGNNQNAFLNSDVRALPFVSNTFDLIYSMGTVEHFPDYECALRELFRVTKPNGKAIIGVPNKLDPFLRPLLVFFLNKLGLYPYGEEKCFTVWSLRRLLESAGYRVTAHTGVLFMPGWLRMADLLFHVRFPRLSLLTGWLVSPFAWLYRRFPWLRRHGYLVVCVADKPDATL